jgi:soluble lytic murein transglycosylase
VIASVVARTCLRAALVLAAPAALAPGSAVASAATPDTTHVRDAPDSSRVRTAPEARPVSIQRMRSDSAGTYLRWTGARDSATSAPADTGDAAQARWRARLGTPGSAPTALRVLAGLRAAALDTVGADSCWRALARLDSPWQWRALQHVAAGALAAQGPAAADSVLAAADRTRWPDGERAAWLERRARLLAAGGDAARAAEFARQLVLAYPGTGAAASRGVALLDSLAAAGGDSLSPEVLRAGAEVDFYRGARAAAIARLRRVLARGASPVRFAVALRLAEVLRAARMPLAARAAADTAAAFASGADERARARLESARAVRDAGQADSALAAFAQVARGAVGSAWAGTAWWEYAREAQDRGRYREALAGFARVAQSGGARADEARFQAGLVQFALGAPDSARTWWRHPRSEAARFWLAVALRAGDRAAGDSLLRALADSPGYGFYRAAARETLGVRGWPAAGRDVATPPAETPAALADVRALLDAGLAADAGDLLARFAAGDARAGARPEPGTSLLLAATALAFEAGRPALGTRLAERAFSAAPGDSVAWAIVPWAYPPAWAGAVQAAAGPEADAALLWALVRQESRFDPLARSPSDALGLAQLKLATAGDVARSLGEPRPTERDLLDPGRSLRFGARYLSQLVRRFGGSVPVALAAYNAGPATVRADWRLLVERGGEALYCEFAANAASQDYARRITGFRQAYRELAPVAPPR